MVGQGIEAEQLFPIAFPDHVGAEILRGMVGGCRLKESAWDRAWGSIVFLM